MKTNIKPNQNCLLTINTHCDNKHKHCHDIVTTANNSMIPITQKYFNDYLLMLGNMRYSCCLSDYYNNHHAEIKKFIVTNSIKLIIENWELIILYISDDDIHKIILNQQALNPNIISQLIKLEITSTYNTYGSQKINLLNMMILNTSKIKSFSHIIMLMSLSEFAKYIDIMPKNYSSLVDNIIIKFIEKNKNNFSLEVNIPIALKIINRFILKSSILKIIYPLIKNLLNLKQQQEILNKTILLLDKNLLLLILENSEIIPNIYTINKLVEKSFSSQENDYTLKIIAGVIDLLCDYGLKINKEIVVKLLLHGYYINNFEKHGMIVDNEILAICADLNFYPYKFDIIPDINILKKECCKSNNLVTIIKLKEFGGIYTSECLEIACGLPNNGKIIKFLINECNIKITEKCLTEFQSAYRIDSLNILMTKYKIQNPIKNSDLDKEKNIEINDKSTMTVLPRNIKINFKDNSIEYKLKQKIIKFFKCEKKTITYSELQEIFLKYLITNKLVIGKYFVINIELSNLLKINHCVIMDIVQINNILTYFIDLPEKLDII